MKIHPLSLTTCCLALALTVTSRADDWPTWGHDPSRNMVSPDKGLPTSFDPGKTKPGSEEIDFSTTKNVKWVAKVGSQAYGNPTVADGRVFIGTNNESPRDPNFQGDHGVVMCFDEKTGKFLWQLVVPKLGTGKVSDWEYLGICSSPTIVGDRGYIVTNRNEIAAFDVQGMANGNDGPFKDEAQYFVGPDQPPVTPGPKDGDLIWRTSMIDEVGVFPHNITNGSPLVVDGRVYTATANGVDWSHANIPAPRAPAFICVDQKTGQLLGEEASGISSRTLHANWSTATYGKVKGQGIVFFGGGDGWLYGFDPVPEKDKDGLGTLKEIWKFDCNPPEYRTDKNGKPLKYALYEGPSEVIATPVFYKDRVYVAIGQDPEHGEGLGMLWCIDASKKGDVTKTAAIWSYQQIGHVLSTISIADGLVYVGEFAGKVHCLDAETGKHYWEYDTKANIWGSTLVADGKVYIGNEDGNVTILAASKDLKVINTINMASPVYSSPVAANGVLYIATQSHLYALQDSSKAGAPTKTSKTGAPSKTTPKKK